MEPLPTTQSHEKLASPPPAPRRKRGRPRKTLQQLQLQASRPKKPRSATNGSVFAQLQAALVKLPPLVPAPPVTHLTTVDFTTIYGNAKGMHITSDFSALTSMPFSAAENTASPPSSYTAPKTNYQKDLTNCDSSISEEIERTKCDVSESVLTLLIDEIRELKNLRQELKQLREKVTRTQEQKDILMEHIIDLKMERQHTQQRISSMLKKMQEQAKLNEYFLERLNSSSPSPSSSSSSSSPHTSPISAASPPLTSVPHGISKPEILCFLPFLSGYDLANPENNFILSDLRQPFAAFVRPHPDHRDIDLSIPPTFIFANEAFCNLVNYPSYELLGCTIHKISTCQYIPTKLIPFVALRSRTPISKPVRCFTRYIDKEGREKCLATKMQFFYDSIGVVRWLVIIVDDIMNAHAYQTMEKYKHIVPSNDVILPHEMGAIVSAPSHTVGSGEGGEPNYYYNNNNNSHSHSHSNNARGQRLDIDDLAYFLASPSSSSTTEPIVNTTTNFLYSDDAP